ncbi:hypothetical protein AVEN_184275-1 [Araneus ventricosus]|uniref:Uncharacterized protein n=1 Tax=Araneus ventricosus TaxID=182803 RepID=A0A4Y2M723_ARAVE|nr:hypothetical protein AVEN_245880-1 [Araneus ventricosus]GBN22293.1 hypothetical protein AVEN_72943-1 [Araneus ventricosus]GBN22296.1 hypothetical protein AVEN_76562-1 [Araneus ventricosus]GBN22305.1 hypothetical protein AVEN_184275-1 [Araneus ventricosus]
MLSGISGSRWPSGKVPVSRPESSRFGIRFPLCICRAVIPRGPNVLPLVNEEVWKKVPARALSSDSDTKLRGPSQNSPRVTSKRDVNITKLGTIGLCWRQHTVS